MGGRRDGPDRQPEGGGHTRVHDTLSDWWGGWGWTCQEYYAFHSICKFKLVLSGAFLIPDPFAADFEQSTSDCFLVSEFQ